MKTNDNQFYIYIRSTKECVPVTKEDFDNYYRDINAYRRTQQNHGRCVCPPSKRLSCDMDCCSCPYHTPGDTSSLDSGRIDNEGSEMSWLDELQEEMPDLQTPSPADYVSDILYMRQILDRLREIMPQAIEIGRLREMGLLIYLRCVGDMDILDVQGSVGICGDKGHTATLYDLDDSAILASVADALPIQIADFFHTVSSFLSILIGITSVFFCHLLLVKLY